MSRVLKIRLGARQVRTFRDLMLLATGAKDAAISSMAKRVARQLGVEQIPESEPLKLAEVIPISGWCLCGHEHGQYTATGQIEPRCMWLFCGCRKHKPRAVPTADERAELKRKFDADWERHHAERVRRSGGEKP